MVFCICLQGVDDEVTADVGRWLRSGMWRRAVSSELTRESSGKQAQGDAVIPREQGTIHGRNNADGDGGDDFAKLHLTLQGAAALKFMAIGA